MTEVKCTDWQCPNNKENRCQLETLQLGRSKLNFVTKSQGGSDELLKCLSKAKETVPGL